MGERQPVLHAETTVEGHLVFDAFAHAAAGLRPGLIGRTDGFDELFFHPPQVLRIGTRRFLVGQRHYQRRGEVVLARQDHASRAGRMRMRRTDQNRLGGDAAFFVNRLTDGFHQGPTDGQGVDADQGNALLSVVEDRRPDFARIVQRLVERLAVSAGLFHTDVRRDVALRKPDFQQRFRCSGPSVDGPKAGKQRYDDRTSQNGKAATFHLKVSSYKEFFGSRRKDAHGFTSPGKYA